MSIVTETLDPSHPGVCGAVGCHDELAFVVNHPKRGEIYLCRDCAEPFEIVRMVEPQNSTRGDVQ